MDDGKILFEALGIRYSVARSADLPEMTRLLGETFARHDPPAVAVGLTAQEFERLVEVFSQTAALDELTVITGRAKQTSNRRYQHATCSDLLLLTQSPPGCTST